MNGLEAFLAMLGALLFGGAPAELPLPTLVEIETVVSATTAGTAEDAYTDFTAVPEAFGALYFAEDGSDWYWRTGGFSLENVTREVETLCALNAGVPCVEYAIMVPRNRVNLGIPVRAQNDLALAARRTGLGNHVALAVMGVGAYGYAYDFATPGGAAARALAECESRTEIEMDLFTAPERDALKEIGHFDCRLLFTHQM